MVEALLLVSYGAPCCEADVIPFLERLLSGKNVSDFQKERAAAKYYEFARRSGRFSPLNEQCIELTRGIETEFSKIGSSIRVYHGNLYWRPFLDDVIARMTDDGVKFARCFITSAFDSTAGNRRYNYAIESACKKIGDFAPTIERLPLPFSHPLFIQVQADRLCEAIESQKILQNRQNQSADKSETIIFFTAHSIPRSDPFVENYVSQLSFVCEAVIARCRLIYSDWQNVEWELLYQSQPISRSRSEIEDGVQNSFWLLPSIKDRVTALVKQLGEQSEATGINVTKNIIVSPIGFFCESMETVNDLDYEIGDICKNSPIRFTRVLTVGVSSKICRMIVQLTEENCELL
jgi:ferrochelatase